jgi:hypothetical protein
MMTVMIFSSIMGAKTLQKPEFFRRFAKFADQSTNCAPEI